MSISDLGEFALISRLTRGLSSRSDVLQSVGDDCAIFDLNSDLLLLATCDSQVEGVHFTLRTSSPEDIGHKALAVNLSDIAAMGGMPRYALISLILPAALPVEVLDGIYTGLNAEAELAGAALVGGNIAGAGSSNLLIIDITLLGVVERGHALLRSGARPGDTLCLTGAPGEAAAGLYILHHPEHSYPQDTLSVVQSRQRMPQARLRAGRVLAQFGPDAVTALLDVSDGLSGDLGHLCECSRVGARLEVANLPLSSSLRTIAARAGVAPEHWALHGGEDYELLFTVAPEMAHHIIEAVQREALTDVSVIGTIVEAGEGIQLLYPDGRLEPLQVKSWDHLKH